MTPRRKHPCIDSIPPELCTVAEIKKMLNLNSYFRKDSPRYAHLRYTTVCYKGRSLVLFNRKEIEALRFPSAPPRGYIDVYAAAPLLGLTTSARDRQKAISWCQILNIPCKQIRTSKNTKLHNIYRLADIKRAAAYLKKYPLVEHRHPSTRPAFK